MELVFATQNKNKIVEIKNLVPDGISIKSATEAGFSKELEETSDSLEGNALQKVHQVYLDLNKNCFADDTGLEIVVLDNDPGVYSARFAGTPANAENNIALVLQKMKGLQERRAKFRTIIASLIAGEEKIFEGVVEGIITHEKKGMNGFGYDPIFIPEGSNLTFAEMTMAEKNTFSHRSRAIRKFVEYLNTLRFVKH